jgi:hypothetical protein
MISCNCFHCLSNMGEDDSRDVGDSVNLSTPFLMSTLKQFRGFCAYNVMFDKPVHKNESIQQNLQ